MQLEQMRRKAIIDANTHLYNNFRLLYCEVPKVGCSNWRRLFLVLGGHVKSPPESLSRNYVHTTPVLRSLSSYSEDEIRVRLHNYTKFLFIREPFSRMVSSYRDKLQRPNPVYHKAIGRWILREFRPNADKSLLATGDNVTFREFAQFVIKYNNFKDRHWIPIEKICYPCDINYDFIGKIEQVAVEAPWFLQSVGVSLSYPNHQETNDSRTGVDMTKQFMQQLSHEQRESLYKYYQRDYEIFNYSRPEL
uniref:Carbohydrate sulfotransferase n=1 Tax=Eptatretus burgeri TaxID=7764 RepID=A0A8C4Q655_EPTBU